MLRQKLESKEYDFLRTNQNLGNNIILLNFGGSYAYRTNKESRELDIRGSSLNTKRQILANENYEQFVDENTDTTI